jgi:hypothetical protein
MEPQVFKMTVIFKVFDEARLMARSEQVGRTDPEPDEEGNASYTAMDAADTGRRAAPRIGSKWIQPFSHAGLTALFRLPAVRLVALGVSGFSWSPCGPHTRGTPLSRRPRPGAGTPVRQREKRADGSSTSETEQDTE